jgi:isoleucyl-tRNA synthetase
MKNQYTDKPVGERGAREESVLEFWKRENIFSQVLEKDSPKGEFVFYEGPPTANGRPGMHHVEARAFKDLIPRYKTMQGFHVARKAGWDTHGLPVEIQAEKLLGLSTKKEIEEYGIEAFNQKCKESVWEYKSEWEGMTERMGYWVDMEKPYITYENSYITSVWNVLKTANQKNLLYKDFKVLPWCSRCGTSLSSHELAQPGAYKEVKDLSVTVKFKLQSGQKIGEYITDENTSVIAWTTTPWTLPGNVALAIHPEISYMIARVDESVIIFAFDKKSEIMEGKTWSELSIITGAHLVGLRYEPLYPYLSQIASGEQKEKMHKAFQVYPADFVTATDGTGAVHTAVMYGADDFDLGTAVGLPKVHIVGEDGKYLDNMGFLSGRFVKQRNEKGEEPLAIDIIKDLASRGLLYSKLKYEHSYPHCWRCDTPLLYYARSSWYVRMTELRDTMVAGNQNINWEPSHIQSGRFGEWIAGIRDWSLSRYRYWGTPLPVWETLDGSEKVVMNTVAEMKQYAKKSGNKYYVMRHAEAESNVLGIYSSKKDNIFSITEKGRQQVMLNIEKIKALGITKIVASPFLRTKQTAEMTADIVGLDKSSIVYDDRLVEVSFGEEFEGEKIHSKEHWPGIKADQNKYTDRFTEGESLQDLCKRTGSILYEYEKSTTNETILFVSHGSPIEMMLYHAHEHNKSPLDLYMTSDHSHVHHADPMPLNFAPVSHNSFYELDLHKPFIDQVEMQMPDGRPLVRTSEVIDVWFDSGCMPYAQIGYPESADEAKLMKAFPADYISEAIDQTRGWFYTLHAIAAIMGYPQAYKNVICLGLVMDGEGKKMSKSKGNVLSPWELFNEYGADCVRLWMYSVNQPGESKNCDVKSISELHNKFFRMLDNCVAFYELAREGIDIGVQEYDYSHPMDQWIVSLLQQAQYMVTQNLDEYRVFESARAVREFVTELSQWYIRRSRDRSKSENTEERIQVALTLRYVFAEFAKLIAPFTPFVAEELWQKMGNTDSVHMQNWSRVENISNEQKKVLEEMNLVRDLVSEVLSQRAAAGIKVRQPLASITLPESETWTMSYQEILCEEVNVQKVVVGDTAGAKVVLDTVLTPELVLGGDARDLIRCIQEMRKAAGLVASQNITLILSRTPACWTGSSDMILSVTGATEMQTGESTAVAIEISDGEVGVGIEVI